MNQDLVRLDRFDGSNFTRWQDKVRFLLTALKIFYILDPTLAPLPEPKENDTPQVVAARKKREEDELICRGHILNALSDRLYDLYTNTNSRGRFGRLLKTSTKPRKKRILHKSEDYSLEEIQKHLRIEEESRSRDKMVEESNGGTNKANAFQRPIILEVLKGPKGVVVNAIDEEIIATLSDVCVVQGKVQGWWYDTCATVHVTYDKSLFKTFEDAKGYQEVQMGNEGNPSGDLLGKPGIKAVFESGKLILSKSGNFVGKGLAHVGLSTIKRIVKCGLIACDTKKFENDLCELNGMLTRGGNRIPMKKNEISPYELWKGRKPNIGYASNSKAYRLLDLESNVIIESREVEFFENLLSDSNSQVPTSVGESLEETPSKVVEQPIVPRKSQRARKEKVLGSDEIDSQRISFYLVEGNREDIIRKIPIVLQIEEDPKTYKEAMASRDVAFWKEAINDEMDSIMSNQTWELVDLPPGSKPIGCKWVFRRKYHTDGMIQTFKARLVAKGFKQREGIIETKRFLSSTFKMKDLGEVDTILGIKVKRNSGGYALNQTHYIEKVVSKFSHLKIKDANTPFDSSIKLEKNDGRSVAQLEYASAIGSLMYAAQCTRADISFAVSKLSRFISNPSVEHWKAIGRVLGYLKNTKELSLQYSKFPAIIEGYSDASWISSVGDNLSTTGWVFTLGGGAVSWGSKKQTCISHSTMEAEFIALAATGKEAEWLRDLMMDIPFTANNVSTVSIHCDSQATLARAYSGVYNGKSRHISIRHEVKLKAFNEIQSMCDKHLKDFSKPEEDCCSCGLWTWFLFMELAAYFLTQLVVLSVKSTINSALGKKVPDLNVPVDSDIKSVEKKSVVVQMEKTTSLSVGMMQKKSRGLMRGMFLNWVMDFDDRCQKLIDGGRKDDQKNLTDLGTSEIERNKATTSK
ncbi:Retrovirus-related Pol polyprotein from transposon TNT 1-94 [Vitis vinifera]|uniref:Retrovirus-related Pol polyprotein from transposon TNT 1-94 n=1 Tax=Vitis vinifera TaxID=29760 RepID=A0A438KQW9_VITVI|nr:Retrovirus-related Pol polyprotein from transposon TNT 1-94 [Vitis vinifera]